MNRYNLALLPATIAPEALRLSQAFAPLSDNYLLGQASLPHVTLCHFHADESALDDIWAEATRVFPEQSLQLVFNTATTHIIGDKLWAQLEPQPLPRLRELHLQIAAIIKTPLNSAFENYCPHLTLANIKNDQREQACRQVAALRIQLSDDFSLALGHCDGNGQFTAILRDDNGF